jgi:hypothetical protein
MASAKDVEDIVTCGVCFCASFLCEYDEDKKTEISAMRPHCLSFVFEGNFVKGLSLS